MNLAAEIVPHNAVILAVDTAEISGWSLWVRGRLASFGEYNMTKVHEDYPWENFVRDCWGTAHVNGLPFVLVYERPFRGTTQGQWIGAWKREFLLNGGKAKLAIGVYPSSWRARVLGKGSLPREVGRRREMDVALELQREWRVTGELGGDSAAAVCIGYWASRAGEVGERLPKRKAKP